MGINIVTSASGAPLIAWMGHSPNTGVQGFWAQRCWIGGTSEVNAAIVASSTGAVSIQIPGGTATLKINGTDFFRIQDSFYGSDIKLNNFGISVSFAGNPTSASVQNIGFTVFGSNGNSSLNDGALYLRNFQVLSTRQAGPGNPSFSSVAAAQIWCQNLLNALRAHGLVT